MFDLTKEKELLWGFATVGVCCAYCNPSLVYLDYKHKAFQRAAAKAPGANKELRYVFQNIH